MVFEQKLAELQAYLKKWGEDTRKELGLPAMPNSTIGVSFMPPSFTLNRVPETTPVLEGIYVFLDTVTEVEVIQPCEGDQVFFEFVDRDTSELTRQYMSAGMFNRLYSRKPLPPTVA